MVGDNKTSPLDTGRRAAPGDCPFDVSTLEDNPLEQPGGNRSGFRLCLFITKRTGFYKETLCAS